MKPIKHDKPPIQYFRGHKNPNNHYVAILTRLCRYFDHVCQNCPTSGYLCDLSHRDPLTNAISEIQRDICLIKWTLDKETA